MIGQFRDFDLATSRFSTTAVFSFVLRLFTIPSRGTTIFLLRCSPSLLQYSFAIPSCDASLAVIFISLCTCECFELADTLNGAPMSREDGTFPMEVMLLSLHTTFDNIPAQHPLSKSALSRHFSFSISYDFPHRLSHSTLRQ
jgi:hypothetical protein